MIEIYWRYTRLFDILTYYSKQEFHHYYEVYKNSNIEIFDFVSIIYKTIYFPCFYFNFRIVIEFLNDRYTFLWNNGFLK